MMAKELKKMKVKMSCDLHDPLIASKMLWSYILESLCLNQDNLL